MIAAHAVLRAATTDNHQQVDAAFAHFDLADRRSYGVFLRAHARVLGAIEPALIDGPAGFPQVSTRLDHLTSDLAGLAIPWPDLVPLRGPFNAAALWGMLYVAEGSRLGGGVLAARVGGAMPRRYLAAVHGKGEWRAVLMALDAAAADRPQAWHDHMIDGARRTFDLYTHSAAVDRPALA